MTARLGDKKADSQQRHNSENRRANKPLMEKRRRARINQSLALLKTIVVDTNKIEGSHKHAKLEKADILELTVKHLQSLQNLNQSPQPNNNNNGSATNNNSSNSSGLSAGAKFQQGFEECTREVASFLASASVEKNLAANLIDHLKQHRGEITSHFVETEEIIPSSPFSPLSNSRTISSPSPCPSMKSSQDLDSQDLQLQLQSISMLNSNSNSNSSNSLTSMPMSSSSVSLPPFVTTTTGGPATCNSISMSADVNSRSPLSGDVAGIQVQVIPTRLANGQVVFLLPNGGSTTVPGSTMVIGATPATNGAASQILIKNEIVVDPTTTTATNSMSYPEEPLDFRRKPIGHNIIACNNNINDSYLMNTEEDDEDEDRALDLCTKLKRSNQMYDEGDSVWRPW